MAASANGMVMKKTALKALERKGWRMFERKCYLRSIYSMKKIFCVLFTRMEGMQLGGVESCQEGADGVYPSGSQRVLTPFSFKKSFWTPWMHLLQPRVSKKTSYIFGDKFDTFLFHNNVLKILFHDTDTGIWVSLLSGKRLKTTVDWYFSIRTFII